MVPAVLRFIDTRGGSHNCHYVNPSTRGSPRMPKERRARSLTVSAISLTFRVDTARRQRMPRTESSQDGRTRSRGPNHASETVSGHPRRHSCYLTIPNALGNEGTAGAQYAGSSGLINIKRDDALLHYLYVAYAPWIGQSAGPARGARRSLVGEPGAPAVPTPAAARPSETGNRTPPGTARPEIQRKELAARPTPPARPLGQVRTGSFRVLRAPTP